MKYDLETKKLFLIDEHIIMKTASNTNSSTVIEMERLDEEIISPEAYLKLTQEQRRNILKVNPLVKRLGSSDVEDSTFAALRIKWKSPRYTVKL